jgi:ribosomal-protein-alanine N-acetyltransferase
MIRAFNTSDKPALFQIFMLNTPDYFAAEEKKDFEAFLDEHAKTYFVVEENGVIVGCGGYHFNATKTEGRISWDLFHPAYRGKGFGRQLVTHCLEAIRNEASVRKISVWTSQLAFRFYARFGFKTKEIKKDYWGKGLDLYRMELESD